MTSEKTPALDGRSQPPDNRPLCTRCGITRLTSHWNVKTGVCFKCRKAGELGDEEKRARKAAQVQRVREAMLFSAAGVMLAALRQVRETVDTESSIWAVVDEAVKAAEGEWHEP